MKQIGLWGALRNKKSIERFMGQDAIFIRNMTRNDKIAFRDKVQYFGGSLLMLIPNSSCNFDLDAVVEYLNSPSFKQNYMYSGRFKIGHKQLCSCLINLN